MFTHSRIVAIQVVTKACRKCEKNFHLRCLCKDGRKPQHTAGNLVDMNITERLVPAVEIGQTDFAFLADQSIRFQVDVIRLRTAAYLYRL